VINRDGQDEQDGRNNGKGMLHEELTGKILEASFEVIRELGASDQQGRTG
jgi:hypothetical protein